MAEIHVQTKKHSSSPVWLWIVLVLIAGAVVYFLTRDKNKNENTTIDNPTSVIQYNTAPVIWAA